MLIAVLFIQESIKGVMGEFNIRKGEDSSLEKYQFHWIYTNGLLGIIFSFGLLYTFLRSRRARSWKYGTGSLRSFIADYGVPLTVLVWTALSYGTPSKVPNGVPRRLFSPLPWESASLHHWTVVKGKPEGCKKVPVDIVITHVIFKQDIVTSIVKLTMGSTVRMWIRAYDSKDLSYK